MAGLCEPLRTASGSPLRRLQRRRPHRSSLEATIRNSGEGGRGREDWEEVLRYEEWVRESNKMSVRRRNDGLIEGDKIRHGLELELRNRRQTTVKLNQ